jgi:DNA-binding PadR family transcriptional regulator
MAHKEVKDIHGQGPTTIQITAALKKLHRQGLVASAVKHYKADRIAYKATRGTQSALRLAGKRPGPVILRPELVREMNAKLQAA